MTNGGLSHLFLLQTCHNNNKVTNDDLSHLFLLQSYHYVCDTCLSSNENKDHWPVHLRDLRKLRVWTTVDFTNLISLNELMVPTCSYRMGTKNMGYGVAVISK